MPLCHSYPTTIEEEKAVTSKIFALLLEEVRMEKAGSRPVEYNLR